MRSNKEKYVKRMKKLIQRRANIDFPAQELWYRDSDDTFWCYREENNSLKLVDGTIINGVLHYDVSIQNMRDGLIEQFCDQKTNEGYECYAILL